MVRFFLAGLPLHGICVHTHLGYEQKSSRTGSNRVSYKAFYQLHTHAPTLVCVCALGGAFLQSHEAFYVSYSELFAGLYGVRVEQMGVVSPVAELS